FNLLDDCWAMVETDHAKIENYFSLADSLKTETANAIWDQMLAMFHTLDEFEQNRPGHANFQFYACRLLRPQFQRLGWKQKPGEPADDTLLRGKIISGLGHFGDKTVIAEAKSRFEKFLTAPESLPPDLRPAVLKIVGRYSDRRAYDQIHQLALHAHGTEDRELCYNALCAALDPNLARQTLALSLTNEASPEEAVQLVIAVAATDGQTELAWEFARHHLQELLAKVDPFSRNGYVPAIFSSFSDAARADELESFAGKNLSEDTLAKARETAAEIRFKAALKKRVLPSIDLWTAGHIMN
ncbi:MAG TPA: ERAP1-like C-terminal domain-containing protein, partial [Verrucomicrobiae bacterium]|nr:ERAP1-like C-terminal domain-containing protein [Verrucomicrobiae bacterium]